MTVQELIDQLKRQIEAKPERANMDVVIKTQEIQMGPVAYTETTGAGEGIDWNKGRMFIGTIDNLLKENTVLKNPNWLKERVNQHKTFLFWDKKTRSKK